MAEIIKKTQFEKIVPFPVLNEIMLEVKELEAQYDFLLDMPRVANDFRSKCQALVFTDKEDAMEIAAIAILYLKMIQKIRTAL